MRTVLFLVLFVMLASLVLHHPPLESLLFAVALAVGLTPEFLPMIMSVTLTQGAVHMARQQVIVKHLAAIEDFGSMDVLCSDKTGTLTTGTMVLERCLDPVGHPDERPSASPHSTASTKPASAARSIPPFWLPASQTPRHIPRSTKSHSTLNVGGCRSWSRARAGGC